MARRMLFAEVDGPQQRLTKSLATQERTSFQNTLTRDLNQGRKDAITIAGLVEVAKAGAGLMAVKKVLKKAAVPRRGNKGPTREGDRVRKLGCPQGSCELRFAEKKGGGKARQKSPPGRSREDLSGDGNS
jgi:hypothetical protein